MPSKEITDDLDLLLRVMPPTIRESLNRQADLKNLIEVVMDLGRQPEGRFPSRAIYLSEPPIAREDLDYVIHRVGAFTQDNRAGIERTLHRISAIRNRRDTIVGLTCRVGRAVFGTVDILRDVVESGKSVLLLGRPGVGKTTLLRESARVLSTELTKRVIVVDTSNEIAGDGDIPHPGIGTSRRMQVPRPELQHAVMIEAVENHMPEVIVIDEIGTEAEAIAARTIAERGVQLIATAHGNSIDNLLMNPTLADLLGGIHPVTLSDEEARRRGTQKTVLERKAPPTFDTLVEIRNREEFSVYHDTDSVVDSFLRGRSTRPEVRIRKAEGFEVVEGVVPATVAPAAAIEEPRKRRARERGTEEPAAGRKTVRIYPYGVSKDRLMRAINDLQVSATIAKTPKDADVVLTLKAHEKRQPRTLKDLEDHGLEVAIIRSNTVSQMKSFLMGTFGLQDQKGEEDTAMTEVTEAVDRVMSYGKPVELAPQSAHIRRLQHQLIEQHGLGSESRGEVPWRRVIVLPTRG
ncbi:MAG TPA: R3H domain-containing nucleic acid-binding protein [Terriglobia bacterium]|nr:R3H domain-containing nucleic acid-binding protein [Terriglobia bacterium]